jgi:hypothetical protein
MSRISNNAILDKLQKRLSGPSLPTVPCILGPFMVHHVLYDWRAIMNILPKMVYDYLDEDPLVPTPHQTRWIINMKVDGVHEKFIYHTKNLICCYQIRVHQFAGSRKIRCVEILSEDMRSRSQLRNKRL